VVRTSLRALDIAAGGKPKPPEVEQPMLDVGVTPDAARR
jgi:hypothetical protein